jgi:hypothetical protein
MKIFGPGDDEDREGIISFELEGVHPHDVSEILDRHGVAVRAGHHCAQVLMDRLGVPATTRASFAVYNTTEEVDRMIDALNDARRIFGSSPSFQLVRSVSSPGRAGLTTPVNLINFSRSPAMPGGSRR